MNVDARKAGFVAALVPLAAVVAGASVVELIPRMIVSGLLVYVGLGFIVDWLWDKRHTLPRLEWLVVAVILAVIIVEGYLAGIVVGLVLAAVLFAFSYGRVDLARAVPFGEAFHSNVDRPPAERAALRELGDRVAIVRLSGFVFFGSTPRLLRRVRAVLDAPTPPRFLVIDLQRATGMDSSAVVALAKVARMTSARGTELVLTGVAEQIREQLERGGVTEEGAGSVRFEPDLDRGLERCEDALLDERRAAATPRGEPHVDGVPAALAAVLERLAVPEGGVVIRQDEPPGDVFVLAEGSLAIETTTPEGRRVRLRILRPGAVVGEVALYTRASRTADVVAVVPSVVLRCSRERIERIEADDPALAIVLHRWFASTLAERLTGTMHTTTTLLD
jgi:SulP family sulfate permease